MTPLQFLGTGWFTTVMGLAGLALAWHAAVPLMGDGADAAALVIGGLAVADFVLLLVLSTWRWHRLPKALAEELRHPVRHTALATLPAAAILVATLGVALAGPGAASQALWWAGCAGQLAVTAWVLQRWWGGQGAGGLQWAGITPALIVPVVGNVLAPLAGMALGQGPWAAAQFGVGLFLWPLVVTLIGVRIAAHGPWAERLQPTVFVLLAPPAAIGLSALQLGAAPTLVWMCWGLAAFTLLWVGTQLKRIVALPFSLAHWSMSFPLTAFAALTLRLALPGSLLSVLGPALLALVSLLIAALLLATWRGLRDGSLLAPEPVALLQPQS